MAVPGGGARLSGSGWLAGDVPAPEAGPSLAQDAPVAGVGQWLAQGVPAPMEGQLLNG